LNSASRAVYLNHTKAQVESGDGHHSIRTTKTTLENKINSQVQGGTKQRSTRDSRDVALTFVK